MRKQTYPEGDLHPMPSFGIDYRKESRAFGLSLGLVSSGHIVTGPDGRPLSHGQTIRNLIDEGIAAEESGVGFFGIGEHHAPDRPLAAMDMILAAIAARTTRIRLGPAVTELSLDDPVRVFQRCSTLAALSGGRAEVVLGRGSDEDACTLFGYDVVAQERLFEEKAQLFAKLLKGGRVTWAGSSRAPLIDQLVVPNLEVSPLLAWVVGQPRAESVIRTARYGFSLMFTIVEGPAWRLVPYVQLFREALTRFHRPQRPVGVQSPGHVAATDAQAHEEFWPHYEKALCLKSEGSGLPRPTETSYLREVGPDGALYVGSPETVAQKITATVRSLGATRFDLRYGVGGLSREALLTSIQLYGSQVVPRAIQLVSSLPGPPAPPHT